MWKRYRNAGDDISIALFVDEREFASEVNCPMDWLNDTGNTEVHASL